MSATANGLGAVLEAARRGDASEAARATGRLARQKPGPSAVHSALDAALGLGHPGFVQAAASLAITADLPMAGRVQAALKLALASCSEQALAVLLSVPQPPPEPQLLSQVMVVLREVHSRSAPGSLPRDQAAALSGRLVPSQPLPLVASERAFQGRSDAPPMVDGPPATIIAATGLPSAFLEEARIALAAFDRELPQTSHPAVKVVRDVFVNGHGQIWNREGHIFRSFGVPLPAQSRRAEASAPELEEAALAVTHHNNMYHWLAEWLPSLAWRLDDARLDMPILIRDHAQAFVRESLLLGAAGPLPVMAVGDAVFVRRLHLVARDLRMLARKEAVGLLFDRLRRAALAKDSAPAGRGRPLYISRRDSQKRPMANEAELERELADRGFDIVLMSTLPFGEQVAMISAAPLIVAGHGAGLGLLAAATPGRRVLEAVPVHTGRVVLRTCMARLSRIVGHEHHLWLEDAPAHRNEWSLDLAPFLAMLDTLSRKAA